MNRRKKSMLFSASLASVGLVAGSFIALSSNTHAEKLESSAMSLSDATTAISEDQNISTEAVSEALATKQIFAKVKDVSVLQNDPMIVSYRKSLGDYYIIEYSTATDTANGYMSLQDSESIDHVILNKTLEVSGTSVSDENLAWGVKTMMLNRFASELNSNKEIKVAVLDTGINANHEAFTENSAKDRLSMDLAYDYVNNDGDPTDDFGHGTMVAGVIAESTPNNVKIVPVKVLDNRGKGNFIQLVDGLEQVIEDVDIINMSLGFEQKDMDDEDKNTFNEVMQIVKDYGPISVAAAGNENASTLDYPAAAPSVIGVTSVDETNTFSSSFSNHGTSADFAAPGENLSLPNYTGNNTYVAGDGTSFASPLVAAAVANILIENPSYNQDQVYEYLKLNAEDLGAAGWDQYYGWGSVSFHVNKYADLKINSINVPANWTNEDVDVTVNASSTAYNISKDSLGSGKVLATPTVWSDISAPAKTLAETITISENGEYTIWLKNSNNETASKTFTVSKIDKVAPAIQTNLLANDITEDGFKLSVAVIEGDSGLSKIEWKYKLDEDDDYTTVTDDYTAGGASVQATTKSHIFTDVEAGEYNAFAVIYDMAGNSVSTDKLNFTLSAEGGEFGGEVLIDETPADTPSATQTGAGISNPKTDSQSMLPVSIAGGAFILIGAAIAIRRRR